VYIDKKALDDVGLGSDTPVTVSRKGISLGSALRILLDELGLRLLLQDEVLKITTPEQVDNNLTQRVFLVRDFSPPQGNSVGAADAGRVPGIAGSCTMNSPWPMPTNAAMPGSAWNRSHR